jgi:hypothetical protein
VTIFYCLNFETSLFVTSYDLHGHSGGIRTRLHTGVHTCDIVKAKVILRPTVSRPVYLGRKHPSRAYDQIFIIVRQLRVSLYGALSLTRGRATYLSPFYDFEENRILVTTSNNSVIILCLSVVAETCLATCYPPTVWFSHKLIRCRGYVFSKMLSSNGLFWLHASGIQTSCHNTVIMSMNWKGHWMKWLRTVSRNYCNMCSPMKGLTNIMKHIVQINVPWLRFSPSTTQMQVLEARYKFGRRRLV